MKKSKNLFKKIFSLSFFAVTLLLVIALSDVVSSLITVGGFSFANDSVCINKTTFYAVSTSSSSTKVLASESAQNIKQLGGAGYLYMHNDSYYVLTSIYANQADAEKVLESVIKTKPDSKIIKIDIQQVNLSSNMNSNEKTALTDSLNAFKNSYKKLYDLSVSLDTSIISEVNCKLSINELSNSVNTIYENYNTIFNQNLSSSLIQIKLALSELKTQLSSLSQTSNSTSLSSQIKYTYCKIIEIFKTLANSLSNN